MFISGATGPKAAFINGYFLPTEEKGVDGRVLYSKSGDGSIVIEHFEGKWQVKNVSGKGTAACMASVAGGCALAGCNSRVWRVNDRKAWGDQACVKMATGADAELQVSDASACKSMIT